MGQNQNHSVTEPKNKYINLGLNPHSSKVIWSFSYSYSGALSSGRVTVTESDCRLLCNYRHVGNLNKQCSNKTLEGPEI
jgi:hypothetical protein